MARVLILGGGCRGRRLAGTLTREGHAVRITTRTEGGRAAIEAAGAECWVGTPARLATLRRALDGVSIACWLLASCTGAAEELRALHTTRLELFLTQTIDTTVRGFVYEARGASTPAEMLQEGERIVRGLTEHNAIPARYLSAEQPGHEAWQGEACAAIDSLLGQT